MSTGPLSDPLRNFPPELASLRSVIELLVRTGAALEALARTEARLAAARIDNEDASMTLQADAYRDSLRLLLLSALALPEALVEARPLFDEQNFSVDARREALASWAQEGLPENLRALWAQARLSEEDLAQLDRTVRRGLGDSERTIGELLDDVSQNVIRTAREVEAQSAIVLSGIEDNNDRVEP
jgi:hypothetical protein